MAYGREDSVEESVLAPSTKAVLVAGVLVAGLFVVLHFNQKSIEREAAEKKQAEESRLEEQARIDQEAREKAAVSLQQAAARKLEATARKQELAHKEQEEERQRFERMCLEIANNSTARIETVQKSVERIVSEDKVYFSGFRTPSYSQADFEARQRQVFEEFPFEDGERRYKIVNKTKTEKKNVSELKLDVRIPADGLEIASVLFIVSQNPKPLASLDFSVRDFVYATDTLQPGARIRRTIPAENLGDAPVVYLALLLPDKRSGAVLQIGGEVDAGQRELTEKLFAKFLANIAAKAEERQKTAWLKNRDSVAAAYAQRLVDSGKIITASPGAKGQVGNYINYEFTFETKGGLIRINRNGYIKLEPQQDGTWQVTGVGIDGTDMGEWWP